MTKQLPRRGKRYELTGPVRTFLESGNILDDSYGWTFDEPRFRKIWEDNKDEIIAHFIEKFPTQRPEAFWQYSSPEPRPLVCPKGGRFEDYWQGSSSGASRKSRCCFGTAC